MEENKMKKNILLVFLLTVFVSTHTDCSFKKYLTENTGSALTLGLFGIYLCKDKIQSGINLTKVFCKEKAHSASIIANNAVAFGQRKYNDSCVVKRVRKELNKEKTAKHQPLTSLERIKCVTVGTCKATKSCLASLLGRAPKKEAPKAECSDAACSDSQCKAESEKN